MRSGPDGETCKIPLLEGSLCIEIPLLVSLLLQVVQAPLGMACTVFMEPKAWMHRSRVLCECTSRQSEPMPRSLQELPSFSSGVVSVEHKWWVLLLLLACRSRFKSCEETRRLELKSRWNPRLEYLGKESCMTVPS